MGRRSRGDSTPWKGLNHDATSGPCQCLVLRTRRTVRSCATFSSTSYPGAYLQGLFRARPPGPGSDRRAQLAILSSIVSLLYPRLDFGNQRRVDALIGDRTDDSQYRVNSIKKVNNCVSVIGAELTGV